MRALLLAVLIGCGGPPTPTPVLASPAARPPAKPPKTALLIAIRKIEENHIEVVRIDRDQLVVVTADAPGEDFGWLDEHVLVSKVRDGKDVVLSRFVDGKLVETKHLEQPDYRPVDLYLVGDREVWLGKCMAMASRCTDYRYERIEPGPLPSTDVRPSIDDARRVSAAVDPEPWPSPSTTSGPRDAQLTLTPVDPGAKSGLRVAVTCEALGKHGSFPDPAWVHGGWSFEVRAARWVQDSPAIYEVDGRVGSHDGYGNPIPIDQKMYVRACETSALDGYARLDEDTWASYQDYRIGNPAGRWAFHRGETLIGEIEGAGSLRVNK